VRYFFNKVEESFPFVDNLRPRTWAIAWIFENRFFEAVVLLLRYFGKLRYFLKVFLSRSSSDRSMDKKIARNREMLYETAQYDLVEAKVSGTRTAEAVGEEVDRVYQTVGGWSPIRKGGLERSDLEAIIQADSIHRQGLIDTAREDLTLRRLEKIDEMAREERGKLRRKIGAMASLLLPLLLLLILGAGLLFIFGVPAVIISFAERVGTFISDRYALWLILSGAVGFLAKQLIGLRIRESLEEKDFLVEAAKRIWESLQDPIDGQGTPSVKYLVFGHTHDPKVSSLGEDGEGPWYVNTGSWLHSVNEVESWDRLERDFTFLRITQSELEGPPGLYRWNQSTSRAERIRRRAAGGDPDISREGS
jgi:hypothetical protein